MSLFALLVATAPLAAQDLAMPEGDVLLTVTGAITVANDGDAAAFDRAMLEDLDPVTVKTTTIWTDGVQTFTGVPLDRLMDVVGATGAAIDATAINDYSVEIPASDWEDGGPIVAFLNNGETMSVRDKGPLWIVWPFDDNPEFQTETIYSRSIWQLDRIVVTE
ncbi:oxidoreductase [Roseivivax halodurans JCM 10272]|uniref:Oxidoreductase n=1 Tax=Roseivivax halodurans JCM 10272 TaxID=1449350 RepID=X7EK01_9RHOB|nr:oxidoreductase [Roseivivax halodurans JCM 10272]